jgi:hypothetical protein
MQRHSLRQSASSSCFGQKWFAPEAFLMKPVWAAILALNIVTSRLHPDFAQGLTTKGRNEDKLIALA